MADETVSSEPGGSNEPEETKADDKDERRRENLSRRAQKAESEAKDLRGRLSELTSKMEEMQDQLDGKSGSIEKTIERKDKEIARLKETNDSLMSEFETFKTNMRRDKFVSAIHADFPDVPRARLEGLVLIAQQRDSTFDPAPEDIDKHTLTSAVKLFKSIDPSTFEPKPAETGRTRPRPGPAPREHTNGLGTGERSTSIFEQNLAGSKILKAPDDRPF